MVQANCHNPTGLDLNEDQWKNLFTLCQDKSLILLVDMAFVGMSNGIDEDFQPFRNLAKNHPNLFWFFAVSYSKCFTMYNERVGSVSVISDSKETSKTIRDLIKVSARGCYSNPPARGSEIISTLLQDEKLVEQWKGEIKEIGRDIARKRDLFVESIGKILPEKKDCFTGGERKTIFMDVCLTKSQNQYFREKFGIYNWEHHFNITTIDTDNMDYVCKCFADALTQD